MWHKEKMVVDQRGKVEVDYRTLERLCVLVADKVVSRDSQAVHELLSSIRRDLEAVGLSGWACEEMEDDLRRAIHGVVLKAISPAVAPAPVADQPSA